MINEIAAALVTSILLGIGLAMRGRVTTVTIPHFTPFPVPGDLPSSAGADLRTCTFRVGLADPPLGAPDQVTVVMDLRACPAPGTDVEIIASEEGLSGLGWGGPLKGSVL